MKKENNIFYIKTRVFLCLIGIGLVVSACICAFGILSILNIKSTLIISEVVPFITLAIGVDNIFILLNEYERIKHNEYTQIPSPEFDQDSMNDQDINKKSSYAIQALENMGFGMLISCICQTVTFLIAYFVEMPAVSSFAVYTALSIFLNFIFQISIFIIALENSQKLTFGIFEKIKTLINNKTSNIKIMEIKDDIEPSKWLSKFIEVFSSIIVKKRAKKTLFGLFIIFFLINIYSMHFVKLGLEQNIAIPKDSYMQGYFSSIEKFLRIGPPLYFVSIRKKKKESISSSRKEQTKHCSRFSSCNTYSLPNILELEMQRKDVSYIAQPSSVFIDDFFYWLNPKNENCCNLNKNNGELCDPNFDNNCKPCLDKKRFNITMKGLPKNEEFMKLLDKWLKFEPSPECPLGGNGPYTNSINIKNNKIEAFYYRTYHTKLASQNDYINALKSANRIATDFNKNNKNSNYEVFPYSIYYVFFEQYTYITSLAFKLGLIAIAVIFVINTLFAMKSIRLAIINSCVIVMIIISIVSVSMCYLKLFGVDLMLNAVSVVNIIMSVGIAVEFVTHITTSYKSNLDNLLLSQEINPNINNEAVIRSMQNVGKSVLTGIAFTKIVGVLVLAFTSSQLFKTYYFYMYLVMVCMCTVHSMVLLPVLLSMFGFCD